MKIHCGNDFVWTSIIIENGYVKSIYNETGRDGGYIYVRDEFGDDLQEKLNHIAYDWGKEKYNTIKWKADYEGLLSFEKAYKVIADRIDNQIQSSLNYHEEEMAKLRMERAKNNAR